MTAFFAGAFAAPGFGFADLTAGVRDADGARDTVAAGVAVVAPGVTAGDDGVAPGVAAAGDTPLADAGAVTSPAASEGATGVGAATPGAR